MLSRYQTQVWCHCEYSIKNKLRYSPFLLSAPVQVEELVCTGDSSSELGVTWRESQLPDEELVQYRVEVLKYVQDVMRRVSTTPLTPQYNEWNRTLLTLIEDLVSN